MAHTDIGYITAPVRMKADVQWVLYGGDTSASVTMSGLAKRSNVNLWAVHKPTDGTTTGVTPKKVSLTDLPSYSNGGANGWVRKTPTAPYHLLDWNGYRHRGVPCTAFEVQGTPTNASGQYFTAVLTISNQADVHSLTTLVGTTCYFGVYCVGESNSETHRSQNSTAVSASGGGTFRCLTNPWTAQWYKVYPFLADASGNYYSVPNVFYDRVYVREQGSPTPQIPVQAVTIYDDYNGNLNGQTISIPFTSGTHQLHRRYTPSNATPTSDSWSARSGNATIDSTGKLTFISKGTETVYLNVSGASGSYASASVTINIT